MNIVGCRLMFSTVGGVSCGVKYIALLLFAIGNYELSDEKKSRSEF